MLGAFFQIKALQAPFLPKFTGKELNENMTSKKNVCTLILSAIFVKSKAHTAILRRYSHILPKFPHIFCPDFHQIKSFGGALAPLPTTPVLKNIIWLSRKHN